MATHISSFKPVNQFGILESLHGIVVFDTRSHA